MNDSKKEIQQPVADATGLVQKPTFFDSPLSTNDRRLRKLIEENDLGSGVFVLPGGEVIPIPVASVDDVPLEEVEENLGEFLPDDSIYRPTKWDADQIKKIAEVQATLESSTDPSSKEYIDLIAHSAKVEKKETERRAEEYKALGLDKFIRKPGAAKTTIEKVYDVFRGLFSDRSWNNEEACSILFHVVLGSVLIDTRFLKGTNEMEPRVNVIWVQSPRSGKTQARSFLKDLSSSLKLNFREVSQFTDAAMIGRIDLPPGRRGSVTPPAPVITKGFLSETDIIFMDDADDFIRGKSSINQYDAMAKKHIRDALNPIGNNTVGKDLRNGFIYFQPRCSVVITCYYFNGYECLGDRSGFWQRFLVYAREIDSEQKKENLLEQRRRQPKDAGTYLMLKKNREDIFRKLVTVLNLVKRGPRTFLIESDAVDYVQELQFELIDYVSSLGAVKQFIEDFVETVTNHIYSIALHASALDDRDVIKLGDVEYASRIAYPLFRKSISWFEDSARVSRSDEFSRFEAQARSAVMGTYNALVEQTKDEWVRKSEVLMALVRTYRKSKDTIYKYWFPPVEKDFLEKRDNVNHRIVLWKLKSRNISGKK